MFLRIPLFNVIFLPIRLGEVNPVSFFSLLEAVKGLVAINEPGLIGYHAKRVFF